MKIQNYAGIDLAKLTFNICIMVDGAMDNLIENEFANNVSGYKQLLDWMSKHHLKLDQTVFCMEHTGLYGQLIAHYLYEQSAVLWIENAVAIKRSMGIQRGKSDKADARNISEYAFKNEDRFKLWEPKRECVKKLHELLTARDRLVSCLTKLTVPIKEFEQTGNRKIARQIEKACRKSIKSLTENINEIEHEISSIIYNDEQLYDLHSLIQTVPGIGKITSMWMICYTNEFKNFRDAKKLACYCGVAPFEYSSGTSVRGKSRVHHMANKKLKTMLHMGALSVIRGKTDMADYYKRKVEEGKNKMLVINAIRNKLIHRLVAVANRGTPYQNRYENANLNLVIT